MKKLINIIINELNKHDIDRSCLLSSFILNQCLPKSEIVKGYLILDKIYVLHAWIKYNNKIYDISYMHFLRNNGISYLPYQLSIEEPNHLKNMDDNSEEFYTTLQNFVKKCIKAVKRNYVTTLSKHHLFKGIVFDFRHFFL